MYYSWAGIDPPLGDLVPEDQGPTIALFRRKPSWRPGELPRLQDASHVFSSPFPKASSLIMGGSRKSILESSFWNTTWDLGT